MMSTMCKYLTEMVTHTHTPSTIVVLGLTNRDEA